MPRAKDPSLAGKTERIDTRVSPATREALEKAAAANGVSLSREIENRLADSLTVEGADMGARREIELLLWGLRAVIEEVEKIVGQQWQNDGFTRDAVADGVRAFVLLFGPDTNGASAPASFPTLFPAERVELRRSFAERVIEQGVGSFCAETMRHTMLDPAPNNEWGTWLQRTYSLQRTAGLGLATLLRSPKSGERR